MKLSKNTNLLLRLVLIPATLLLTTVLLIKAPAFLNKIAFTKEKPAPPVKSFGILMPGGYTVHGIDA